MKNKLLFNASMALVECAKFVKAIDNEYAIELLDKAEEYKNQIVIDDKFNKEVEEFAKEIKKGL